MVDVIPGKITKERFHGKLKKRKDKVTDLEGRDTINSHHSHGQEMEQGI